jgi:hypothetical protein
MTNPITDRIARILKDDTRTAEARIDELLTLRSDARALQRAASESPMGTEDTSDTGLRQIDRALEKLGYRDHAKADEESAATL